MGQARAGLALGVLHDEFNWTGGEGDGSVTSYNLGLYASGNSGNLFGGAYLAGGFRQSDLYRSLNFPAVDLSARSQPEGYSLALGLNSGLNLMRNGWVLQPLAEAHLIYMHTSSFDEHNAQSLNLSVDAFSAWSLRTSLTLGAGKAFSTASGARLLPYGRLGWGLLPPLGDRDITSSLLDQPGSFIVEGFTDPLNTLLVNLGLMARLSDGSTLGLGYDGELGADFQAHSLLLKLKMPF